MNECTDSNLALVVNLYRMAGLPSIERKTFSARVLADQQICDLIESCRQIPSQHGQFREIIVDGKELPEHSTLQTGADVEFTWVLASNASVPFFASYEDLLNRQKSIFKGNGLRLYYIADEDILSSEQPEHIKVKSLESITSLIKLLSKIAHYHDEKERSDIYKLVFVLTGSDNDSYKPLILSTSFLASDLDCGDLRLSALEDMVEEEESEHSHAGEKLSMFRVSLSEILAQNPEGKNPFSHLLSNWSELLISYKRSFDIYISGFAFNKVRTELAKSEVDLANSLSKVISGITGKLFSIPISFAALLTMQKLDSVIENLVFVFGSLVFSLIVSGLSRNQLLLRKSIVVGADLTYKSYRDKKDSYPEDLRACLSEAEKTFKSQANLLLFALWGARLLAWSVTFIATYVFVFKFS